MALRRTLPLVAAVLLPALAAAEARIPGRPAFRVESRGNLSSFTPEQLALIEKLNRADRAHLARLPTIVVPDRWDLDELAYSPLPVTHPWAATYPKALIVHQPSQVFGAYENGRLVQWGPISSGRQAHPTPSGLFHLNWRSRSRRSTINQDWLMEWYFNFQNNRGLALHKYAMPGRPASHACVRLLERDAIWLYDWGEEWVLSADGQRVLRNGTPLWIVGSYRFGAPPPWQNADWWRAPIELPAGP
ncbi:MAG: L,D-transpeptidase [Bryobacteraceae bacterium]